MSIISLKVAVVLSACVLSVSVLLKHYSDFVPSCWNIMLQCLKPPYLYLLINGIIISIVASSKLQHKDNDDDIQYHPSSHDQISAIEVSVYDHHHVQDLSDSNKKVVLVGDEGVVVGDEMMVTPSPQRSDSMDQFSDSPEKNNTEKPPVSTRFGHRKAVKAIPESAKALSVSKTKRNETLESTWKTITEGRAMPLKRHLKKSDTWDSHVRQDNTPPPAPQVKKAETFHKRTTNTSSCKSNSGRLKREPSLSQDELNRRVEAFINKFNEEMRLQRQRSLEQYNQMILRGAY